MAVTTLAQTRSAVTISGVTKYRILTTVTDKGDLDDSGLFLVNIVDSADPKNDTLERVVGLGDLPLYKADRTAAIAAGDLLWRAPDFTRDYDALDLAIAAYQITQDRVSALVSDWAKYSADFAAVAAAIPLPLVSASLLATTINAYIAANTAVTTAQTDSTTANAALAAAQVALVAAQSKQDGLKKAVDAVAIRDTSITNLRNVVTALETICVKLGSGPSTGFGVGETPGGTGFYKHLDTLLVNLNQNTNNISVELLVNPNTTIAVYNSSIRTAYSDFVSGLNGALKSEADAACGVPLTNGIAARDVTIDTSDLNTEYELSVTEVRTRETEIITTKRDALEKLAALESAKTVSDTALAAVIDLCPTFDVNDPTAKIS